MSPVAVVEVARDVAEVVEVARDVAEVFEVARDVADLGKNPVAVRQIAIDRDRPDLS